MQRFMSALPATFALLIALAVPSASYGEPRAPFTVADGISLRTMVNMEPNALAGGSFSISPSGRQYIFFTQRGDAASGLISVEAFTGATTSLAQARNPRLITTLTTTGARGRDGRFPPTYPMFNRVVWLGEGAVAFLWSDGRHPNQVYRLDLANGAMTQLTHHANAVQQFGINADGSRIFYVATPAFSPED